MENILDPIDRHLLDDWQRDFPLSSHPFAEIAAQAGSTQSDVLERLMAMQKSGRVSRVGATCAPNVISASTLAAVAAPEDQIERVAQIIGAFAGVNHSYQRENIWNLWFVATGPDRQHVDRVLQSIQEQTGLPVLDLRLVRPFNIDLGFRMQGPRGPACPPSPPADPKVIQPGDKDILQALITGLDIVPTPFAQLARNLKRPESEVLERIKTLQTAGLISRLGVIVRHRALGWSANAMVVWDITSAQIDQAGPALAALPGITLCYERRPVPGIWPYRLYSMIHARSRTEARETLSRARALPELQNAKYQTLFSTRCFKQTGALIKPRNEAAA